MEDEEDVTTNPVFITLKQKYPSLYQLVQTKCYIVCVPQTASIAETISEEFLKLHILSESPYFQGTYLTLCDKSVEIENNEITTTQGFEEQRKIKVLSEELFYNAQSQGFRVLLIERPFTGGATVSPNNDQSPLPKERSATAVKDYLDSFPENEIVLRKIDEMTGEFNQTYMIVKGFEMHVVKKVQELYNYSVEALLCANPVFRDFHYKNKNLMEFKEIVEVYVLNRLHAKLWDSFTTIFAKEDNEFFAIATSLKNLRQSDVGIRQALQCSMVSPSRQFKYLDTCMLPLEKLYCLKETCDLIMKTVATNQAPDSEESVTTDDLIPFLVYIIVLSKPKYLRTNIFLMESLTFVDLSTNEMGFNLVSLQAAVQYLKSKELAKFAAADRDTNDSPLKSIFTRRHSTFFTTSSIPLSDPKDASTTLETSTPEKKSTYRISDLTDDSSFSSLYSSSSRVTSSYTMGSAYDNSSSALLGSVPSSSDDTTLNKRQPYKSLTSLFPSFARGRRDKSDTVPNISLSSSDKSSLPPNFSSSSSPGAQHPSGSLASASSASSSPVLKSTSPPPIASVLSTSTSFAPVRRQKPPDVITFHDPKSKDSQNDLGEFLTKLQNHKEDTLSSHG